MIDPAPYARASCSPTEPVPPDPPRIKTVFPLNVVFNREPYHASALYDVSATLHVSVCGVVCGVCGGWCGCVCEWGLCVGWTGISNTREGKGTKAGQVCTLPTRGRGATCMRPSSTRYTPSTSHRPPTAYLRERRRLGKPNIARHHTQLRRKGHGVLPISAELLSLDPS